MIKSGYYIVPNPSTALVITTVSNWFFPGCLWHLLIFLFDYDYTLEEGGVEAEEEASKQLVNMSISFLCFFMFIQVFFFLSNINLAKQYSNMKFSENCLAFLW